MALTPLARIGLLHDDSAGGTGLEGSAGLRFENRSRGLSALLESRALLVSGEVREWGVGADVRLGRGDGLGPLLRSSVSRGDLVDGTVVSWGRGLETLADGMHAGGPGGRGRVPTPGAVLSHPDGLPVNSPGGLSVDTEAGWGLRAGGGQAVLTPFTGWAASEGGAQTLRLGGRLAFAERLRLELRGMRREAAVAPLEHALHLHGTLIW